jgi:hypothetical protein
VLPTFPTFGFPPPILDRISAQVQVWMGLAARKCSMSRDICSTVAWMPPWTDRVIHYVTN